MWADQICSDISDYLLNSPSLGGAFVCEAPLDAPQSWRLPLNTFTAAPTSSMPTTTTGPSCNTCSSGTGMCNLKAAGKVFCKNPDSGKSCADISGGSWEPCFQVDDDDDIFNVGVHTAPKTSPAVGEIDPDSSASSTGSRGAVEWTASYHNPLLLSDVPYTAIQEDGGRHVTADERVLVMECQEGLNPANEKNCGVYVADGAFGQQQSGRMSTYRKVGADGKTLRNPAWYWIHNNDGSRWEYISGSK